jgi:hypothetical protein
MIGQLVNHAICLRRQAFEVIDRVDQETGVSGVRNYVFRGNSNYLTDVFRKVAFGGFCAVGIV